MPLNRHLAIAVLRVSASPQCCVVFWFHGNFAVWNAQSSKPLDGQPWDLGIWAGGGFSVPAAPRTRTP